MDQSSSKDKQPLQTKGGLHWTSTIKEAGDLLGGQVGAAITNAVWIMGYVVFLKSSKDSSPMLRPAPQKMLLVHPSL